MASVWVYAETDGEMPHPVAFELLTRARSLGDVAAVALGPGARQAALKLSEYGAGKVFVNEHRAFRDVLAQPAVAALAALVAAHRPSLLLFGMTYEGRDVASRLSARLGSALIANVTAIDNRDGGWTATSPVFGGTLLVDTRARGEGPPIVLVRPKAFAAEPASSAAPQIETIADPVGSDGGARIVKRETEAAAGPKLEDAAIIVSGGRGMGGPENFKILEDLAAEIGAALGASRAVVDAGWKPYALQIGQTGKTVKPTVYIACGISGAMQHTVGMKGARTIIAINKDRGAPIFKIADLGVVGDVLKIVPQLTQEIRARKSQ